MGELFSILSCFGTLGVVCEIPLFSPTEPATVPAPSTSTPETFYTIELTYWGERQCTPSRPCTECIGDCDSHADCAAGLQCFRRTGQQLVPGCLGQGVSGVDYCYEPLAPFSTNLDAGGTSSSVGTEDFDLSNSNSQARPNVAGSCSLETPCGHCQGDCNTDDDCHGQLRCFHKDVDEQSIPGCKGVDPSDTDYCYDPSITNVLELIDFGVSGCSPRSPCDACQGDCDSDADCRNDQLCWLRDGLGTVPGCRGQGVADLDYCYDPASVTTLTPTSGPTGGPSPAPVDTTFTMVLRNMGNNTDYDEEFQRAADRWNDIIISDLPDINAGEILDLFGGYFPGQESSEFVDDVLVAYEVTDLGNDTVGTTGPLYVRGDGTTIAGIMQFDTTFFQDNSPASRNAIILHELGRVLGLGTRWTTCTGQCGSGGPAEYDCELAVAAYERLRLRGPQGTFVLQIQEDVGSGGSGSAAAASCGSWDPQSFNAPTWTELMIPFIDPSRIHLITAVTLAALEDFAAYQVDYAQADPIPPAQITTLVDYGIKSDLFVELNQIENIQAAVFQYTVEGSVSTTLCIENCD